MLWKVRLLCWLCTSLQAVGTVCLELASLMPASAAVQAQCLCLKIRRLPERLDVGVETYPLQNLYRCCYGVHRVLTEGDWVLRQGRMRTLGPRVPQSLARLSPACVSGGKELFVCLQRRMGGQRERRTFLWCAYVVQMAEHQEMWIYSPVYRNFVTCEYTVNGQAVILRS